ncbi:purine-cytosine permease family protein [Galactobacter caseinivorans]|uniref:Purine-cytosine transporter n=1 Tax=Galactobacter caseinivorans TaxID=2676123 RepID=A0A496PJ74_9MICC|nr:cytosine permease [Galactobacter caseinivorans]RKW70508.1 purine-cytosine transporter [Galactobacter caseinivorans]
MSLYKGLESRLQSNAEDGGAVRGTLNMPRIGMIWLAANLVVTTLLTGTLFIPGLDFGTTLAMIALGTVCGAVVLTLVGNIGTRTGLPTMALTRGAFGTKGSFLPVAANLCVLMGWSWVQAMLAGVTVNHLVASLTGFSNPVLFSVLCEAIVVILAIFGHTGIARVEPWLAVVMLVIIAWIFATAFGAYSPAEFQALPVDASTGTTPFSAFDIVFATAISWTVLSADFNRLARSSKAGILGSGLGYMFSTIISMTLGATAIAYVALRGTQVIAFDPTLLVDAFGAPIAIVIFLSVMATNTMVVYGMTTSVVNSKVGSRVKFLPTALIIGVVSIAGSTWLALLDQFTTFLTVVGSFFVPVFAIMIVDYYLIKRGRYNRDLLRPTGGRYWYQAGVNWIAVGVWIAGALSSAALTYVWPSPIGATVPALAISFVLYLGLMLPARTRGSVEPYQHLADDATPGS